MGLGAASAEGGWRGGVSLPNKGGAWGAGTDFFFKFLAQNSAFWRLFWQE